MTLLQKNGTRYIALKATQSEGILGFLCILDIYITEEILKYRPYIPPFPPSYWVNQYRLPRVSFCDPLLAKQSQQLVNVVSG